MTKVTLIIQTRQPLAPSAHRHSLRLQIVSSYGGLLLDFGLLVASDTRKLNQFSLSPIILQAQILVSTHIQ